MDNFARETFAFSCLLTKFPLTLLLSLLNKLTIRKTTSENRNQSGRISFRLSNSGSDCPISQPKTDSSERKIGRD